MIHSTNKTLLEAFVGCVYYSHPYHAPENIDKILEHLEKFAQHKSSEKEHIGDLWCFSFGDPCQFRKELSEWMMGCLEYRQLNISRKLKDQGVTDIDDERNSGWVAHSAYDKVTNESRYRDFIDLDALMQNVVNRLCDLYDEGCSCSWCKHRITKKMCEDCYIKEFKTKRNHHEFAFVADGENDEQETDHKSL